MRFHTAAAALSAAVLLTACGGTANGEDADRAGDRLEVSVGFYPYAFVAERVGGPDVDVVNLTKPGGEPHDLELTPQQVAGLSETDLVVFSKGFQPAVDEAVEQQAADKALDVLTTVELREGEAHDEQDVHEGEEEGEEHGDEGGQDPHVWLDPVRLGTIAGAVADELAALDPDRADAFQERAAALQAELGELDEELRTGLSSCAWQEIVTSHDAIGYLAGAYGLEQVSLAGLSPDDEASPGRLAEVATYAQENGVTTIFFEETASPRVAESLAREVGAEAVVLSPLEGAPETGDYLSAMRTNLQALQTALDCA